MYLCMYVIAYQEPRRDIPSGWSCLFGFMCFWFCFVMFYGLCLARLCVWLFQVGEFGCFVLVGCFVLWGLLWVGYVSLVVWFGLKKEGIRIKGSEY